jgi:hypothetical protein
MEIAAIVRPKQWRTAFFCHRDAARLGCRRTPGSMDSRMGLAASLRFSQDNVGQSIHIRENAETLLT